MSTATATAQVHELEAFTGSHLILHSARTATPESAASAPEPHLASASPSTPQLSKLRTTLTVLLPALINFFSSFTTSIITLGLPVIATSLSLPRTLYLWPASVFGLTSGALLLIAGSVADVAGPRRVELIGMFLLAIFTLMCGVSATGVQLVVFRALQGIAMALHLPSSVALLTGAIPPGRARNIGFGCLGLSQPLGFSFGLVISGVMIDRAGWRSGFYLCGGAILVTGVCSVCFLPDDVVQPPPTSEGPSKRQQYLQIDWLGAMIASAGFAILVYVLALISVDLSSIRSATTSSLLSISAILLLTFPFWMHYRERKGRKALIPNVLWTNVPFASTCLMIALSYGAVNAIELFSSLYFQEVQGVTTLTASLYLLPSLLVGAFINITVGIFVHRVAARWLVTVSSILCALAPLMMAMNNPSWSYWYLELWAQVFSPMSVDVLFTVGLIIISDTFPEETQALAGAVFSTVSQFGNTLGVGICQVVALGIMAKYDTGENHISDEQDEARLLAGYRAGFWTIFVYMLICAFVAVLGLRQAGKIGLKRE
ncbi:MFS general substrate transporter [Polyplosphaeria fusca]|uniref:MFS general substrate transporter n=1 Tax=Polyplosphaeria fusca TaxID=682080 RepID=A0A9P4QTD7_9PLEO|nr:MFS general substrate transporter [Polyplosphaeria fusca]